MPPKKRERDNDAAKNPIYEQIQADHEMFLQAFEKPTQIYRFLRTRNLVSPVFSERTVTYMRHRMSRSHKNRANFKIDSLLSRILTKQKETQESMMSGYMTLAFTGFFDKNVKGENGETVSVETIILKNCHKKRKDVSAPIMQTSVGKSEVLRNPDPSNPPHEVSAISVPSNNFSLSNGHLVKSYVLLLRVSSPSGQYLSNGICNGELSDSGPDIESSGELSQDHPCHGDYELGLHMLGHSLPNQYDCSPLTSQIWTIVEPPTKKRKNGKTQLEEASVFGAELTIYDKHNRCLLGDGEYELVLQEIVNSKGLAKKHCSWETFLEAKDKPVGPFDAFNKGPTLKFRLTWSDAPVDNVVPMPLPLVPTNHNNNHINNHVITRQTSNVESKKDECDSQAKKKKTHIFYQFLYNNNTRQQTEARDDLHCPWCSLNCEHLYSLLKHLKLCHSRFIFTYVPHPRGARIDVSINECYDGSYAGNPHDLLSQPPGFAFSRNGPVRRTPVTNLLVCCRPKRSQPSLSEFLEPDDSEFDGPRPLVSGHSRCYHHTISCLPIEPQEMEIDSEDENDPEWLRSKTKLMIDEFTDVNEGEKELMKMWNLHIMKYGFVGDCQIPLACSMFIEKHGKELIDKKLYRNFILHMCNLYDFGLIGAAVVFKTVCELQEVLTHMENKEQETNHTQDKTTH